MGQEQSLPTTYMGLPSHSPHSRHRGDTCWIAKSACVGAIAQLWRHEGSFAACPHSIRRIGGSRDRVKRSSTYGRTRCGKPSSRPAPVLTAPSPDNPRAGFLRPNERLDMATAKETASGLTRDDIARLLRYDPTTGVLEWLVRPRRRSRKLGNEAGRVHRTGYVNIKISRVEYAAHRLAWLLTTGDWPEDDVDHINGVKSDNRWANLRAASRRENIVSCPLRRNNTSGVTGVTFNTSSNMWHAYIKERSDKTVVRTFKSKGDAIDWRRSQEAIHYGEFRPRLSEANI